MVQHRMALARRRTGDHGNQGPQHLKTTNHRRRKGTQEDQEKQGPTNTQRETTPVRREQPRIDPTGELQEGISTARRDSGPSTPGSHLGRRRGPGQQERTRETSAEVSWSKVAASTRNTNNKTETRQTKQDLVIEELRAQIAKQNAEIAQLKKLKENEIRGSANFQGRIQGTNPNPFTAQTSPAPIPSPAVLLTLLQDPSGIGLFLAKMQEAFNNRLDQIQSQISTTLRKSGEGKRKLKMPRNPKAEKATSDGSGYGKLRHRRGGEQR